jgi:hypothetical protein
MGNLPYLTYIQLHEIIDTITGRAGSKLSADSGSSMRTSNEHWDNDVTQPNGLRFPTVFDKMDKRYQFVP